MASPVLAASQSQVPGPSRCPGLFQAHPQSPIPAVQYAAENGVAIAIAL